MKVCQLGLLVVLAISVFACKTRSVGGQIKVEGAATGGAKPCQLAAKTWAGRMGMRLIDDGEGGPLIDCTVPGSGLVHIGLNPGDRIAALNERLELATVADFEHFAQELAGDSTHYLQRWEFTVLRDGQRLTVAPSADAVACGVFSFDDCGPLNN